VRGCVQDPVADAHAEGALAQSPRERSGVAIRSKPRPAHAGATAPGWAHRSARDQPGGAIKESARSDQAIGR